MRALATLVVALALARCVEAAPALEVVEAVLPEWPAAQPRTLSGHVDIKFHLLGRQLVRVRSDGTDLPAAFADESQRSFAQWLIEQSAADSCGFVEGMIRFSFDGSAIEPVRLGAIEIKKRPPPGAVFRLDHVEVHAGRIKRAKVDQLEEIAAEEARAREAFAARRQARWEAAGRGRPAAAVRGTPPKVKVWVEPRYPKDALLHGATGDVVLVLDVDADGRVKSAEIADNPEPRVFGGAALAAALKWRLEPARDSDGQAVPSRVCQMITFRLTSVD